VRRNLGTETRSGDPAADDQDIEVNHLCRWLRFGKPRRLPLDS
jgi:hypothetical protein